LYYVEDKLVGYVPLDGFGDSYEITGIVHPDFRRRGIGSLLYKASVAECRSRGGKSLLLVNYKSSKPGIVFVKAHNLSYSFSEYHMVAAHEEIPPLPATELQLVQTSEADAKELSRLIRLSFNRESWGSSADVQRDLNEAGSRYFLASLAGKNIGQIGALQEPGEMYIRVVGIDPVFQGKGYGRQMLALLLDKLKSEGHSKFSLDVVTENRNALSLYISCGFSETTVYDYYIIPII
jgi:ribosomal protein S18 acetylase RimI-like enzyme